jgi:hypothetical protein
MKKLFIIVIVALFISGCVLTKVVTVPLRVAGAVGSGIPIIGNQIDEVIDKSADLIDQLPY